jgi:hypothetical protein
MPQAKQQRAKAEHAWRNLVAHAVADAEALGFALAPPGGSRALAALLGLSGPVCGSIAGAQHTA